MGTVEENLKAGEVPENDYEPPAVTELGLLTEFTGGTGPGGGDVLGVSA